LVDSAAIKAEQLSLWYGDFQALFDVDLEIKSGLITSLIGPSGCGKSTLLRTVNRINERLGYVRTTGRVSVLGHDVFDDGVELVQLRKQVGMVFQRPNPLPLSIRENVLFGLHLHATKRSKADTEALLEETLQRSSCGTTSRTASTRSPLRSPSKSSRSSASPGCYR